MDRENKIKRQDQQFDKAKKVKKSAKEAKRVAAQLWLMAGQLC